MDPLASRHALAVSLRAHLAALGLAVLRAWVQPWAQARLEHHGEPTPHPEAGWHAVAAEAGADEYAAASLWQWAHKRPAVAREAEHAGPLGFDLTRVKSTGGEP